MPYRYKKPEIISPKARSRLKAKSKQLENGCIEYTGSKNWRGYGHFNIGGNRMVGAHRAAWFFEHGEWPEQLVCHKCDNRACVNPDHLYLGSQQDNLDDMKSKGRKNGYKPPLTDAERAEIERLKFRGKDIHEVAKALGITYDRVWAHY